MASGDLSLRKGVGRWSVMILAFLLVLTGVTFWGTRTIVRDQERRLLTERTHEVGLVLSTSIGAVPTSLSALGGILAATDGSTSAFTQAANTEVAANPNLAYGLLRQTSGGYVVEAAAGKGLAVGDVISDARAATMAEASRSKVVVVTPVIGTGANRVLGFALGPPAAPAGTVLYRQAALGVVSSPRAAATAPFHEVKVVLYASPRVDPSQVLVATTAQLPLKGSVQFQTLQVGSSTLLLAVAATQPLVGSVAADAPWFVLAVGVVVALLVGVAVEAESRRRRAAVALLASEHDIAETLQRSLLPELPQLKGLDLAARYLAGGTFQQVGGDWFDVFALADGRVGVVIGDVIGHDIAAATAMSQIRASLRAYAWQGDGPGPVLARLDRLIDAFGLAQLVTVFYGVLEEAAPDGGRVLRYANAGHLPPFVLAPDGHVHSMAGGGSTVIGAPTTENRVEAEQVLPAGSTLLLFTDGLVEVPGGSLNDSLASLAATIAGHRPSDPAENLCERVVTAMQGKDLRDDIAVLAIHVLASQPPRLEGPGRTNAQPVV